MQQAESGSERLFKPGSNLGLQSSSDGYKELISSDMMCNSPQKPRFLSDGETEVDLLVPVESALNSDPRVFRAKGIDSLPAIGIQVSGAAQLLKMKLLNF